MTKPPGLGIVEGLALTLRRFFAPKATIRYPEVPADVPHRFRGRLQLLYDEYGTLKCETCFQCAQACPVECIDMGGYDTRGRYHVHWGPAETYAERREESALRRSGRTVPDPAYEHWAPIDPAPVEAILERFEYDPGRMLDILEATQEAYGYLPVAALRRISQATGAWYAMIYGTASYYRQFRFAPPEPKGAEAGTTAPAAKPTAARPAAGEARPAEPGRARPSSLEGRPSEADYLAALTAALGAREAGDR